MGNTDERINPGHSKVRRVLRALGPLLMLAGVVCLAIAIIDFAMVFGDMSHQPTRFWLFFIGLPLLALGSALSMFGFMGAVFRFAAQEQAPVAADTFNYLAGETQEGVRDVVSAIREGMTDQGKVCQACGADNDASARFCDGCGKPFQRTCAGCQTNNDADAAFCDSCGSALA
ncbi:MAG: zinc ribbon domain-containing protein [Planctomycetota bacterium]|nr:zinc ribbon domain-containing protein [Planctomycetota bacterium]